MKNYFILLLLILCAFGKSQEVSVKVDSATGGRLVIEADGDISKLIDENGLCKKIASSTSSSTGSGKPKTTTTPPKTTSTGGAPGKSSCGKQNDIRGFMIKVGEGKSEAEVNTLITKFKTEFPELRVEKNYLRPDWRFLAGDYFSKESAQADLRRIRRSFPTASLIGWRIYCNRAK